jgi:UPF0716 protein FxsA
MRPGKLILIGCLALPFLEIAAFWLVAAKIGFFNAFFLLLAGSAAGVILLSWLGRRFVKRMMASLQERNQADLDAKDLDAKDLDAKDFDAKPGSLMTGIGALLLALPGFITGAIGIALLLPPVQRWLAANMVIRTERSDGVIELEDGEWRRMPDRRIDQDLNRDPDRPR